MHIRVPGVAKGTDRGLGTGGGGGTSADSDCLAFFLGGEYDGEVGGVMGRVSWEGEESEEIVIVDDGLSA